MKDSAPFTDPERTIPPQFSGPAFPPGPGSGGPRSSRTGRPYLGAFGATLSTALFAALVVTILDVVLTLRGAADVTSGEVLRFASLAFGLYGTAAILAGLIEGVVVGAVRATYPDGAVGPLLRRLGADRDLDRQVTAAILAGLAAAALYAGAVAVLSLKLVAGVERKAVGALLAGGAAAALLPVFALLAFPFYRLTRWIARAVPRLGPVPAALILVGFAIGAGTSAVALYVVTKLDWRALPLGGPMAAAAFVTVQLVWAALVYGPLSGVRERVPGRVVLVGVGAALVVASAVLGLKTTPPTRVVALLNTESKGAQALSRVVRKVADRDRDGYASVLGEGDCNDRDRSVFPGAVDVPGNGIDENCRGGDAVPLAARGDPGGGPAGGPTPTAPPPESPMAKFKWDGNVVVIMVDTLRADRLGVAGYTRRGGKSLTPRMDELANRSTYFKRAYAQSPNTPRSTPSLFTSRYPSKVKWEPKFVNYPRVLPENVSMFEVLKDAGYRTVGVSSHFYFSQDRGIGQGFDEWDNEGAKNIADSNKDIAGPRILPRYEAKVQELAKSGQKFAIFLHLFEPHGTYVEHPEYPISSRGTEGLEEKYDYEIAVVDRFVGQALDALKAAKIDDKTMVILLSDHGEAFGVHKVNGQRMFFHGQTLYDELLLVPLIVHVPGTKPNVVDQPVMLLDVAPTVVDAVKAPMPADFQGRSLLPAVLGESLPPAPVHAELLPAPSWDQAAKMMIDETGRQKIIYKLKENLTEVYDLASDPNELKDLSRSKADLAKELEAKLTAWMERELQ